MELGNQKSELHSILYYMIFMEIYKEKHLIIDSTLSTSLWFKMNCDKYGGQYTRMNYGIR